MICGRDHLLPGTHRVQEFLITQGGTLLVQFFLNWDHTPMPNILTKFQKGNNYMISYSVFSLCPDPFEASNQHTPLHHPGCDRNVLLNYLKLFSN